MTLLVMSSSTSVVRAEGGEVTTTVTGINSIEGVDIWQSPSKKPQIEAAFARESYRSAVPRGHGRRRDLGT
jgi:hypothetical protein